MQNINNQVRHRQQQQQIGSEFPVLSISNAFSTAEFISYINGLSEEELKPLLKAIPEGLGDTKDDLIKVIRSSQFSQGVESLSNVLRQGTLGSVVAREMKYPYSGEGIEGYLNGIYRGQEEERKKKKDQKGDQDADM